MNRDNKGRYARSKRIGKFIVWIIILSIGAMGAWQFFHPVILPPITIDNSDKNFAQKIDSLQNSVVEQIHVCEKQNYSESDGLVTYDPTEAMYQKNIGKHHFINTGELSFGTYQFKQSTVIYYYKTLYNKVITGKEAILIALDDKLAGDLTKDILFKTKDGWKNWINCSNSLNLPVMIQAINKIK